MKHTLTLIAVIVLGLLAVTTLSANSTEVKTIKIDNFNFTPPSLTVHPGTKVTWINKDDVPHTVTSVDKKFGSKVLDTDEQFSFIFTVPGTYKYYCKIHPHMTGSIIVQ